MTDFPLYDLLDKQPALISPMAAYLRDAGRSLDEIEARRKADILRILSEYESGRLHPIFVILEASESALGPSRNAFGSWRGLNDNLDEIPGRDIREAEGLDSASDEFQRLRKGRIEEIVKWDLKEQFHSGSCVIDESEAEWISKTKQDLETQSSLTVIQEIIQHFSKPYEEYGRCVSFLREISELASDEWYDHSQHPNDKLIGPDVLSVLKDYQTSEFIDDFAKDAYLTRDDVELQRNLEIVKALEEWRDGAHPFVVIGRVSGTTLDRLENPFDSLASYGQIYMNSDTRKDNIRDKRSEWERETSQVQYLRKRDRYARKLKQVLREMNPRALAYAGPGSDPEFAAAIDGFIAHASEGAETSYSLVQSVAEAMFSKVDDTRYLQKRFGSFDDDEDVRTVDPALLELARNAPTLSFVRKALQDRKREEDKKFEAKKPMGALRTQTEAEVKEPLKEIFRRRAKRQQKGREPLEKLTEEIHIEPTGSGMIMPYPLGPDVSATDVDLDGTITARVTTYSVTLVPKSPDASLKLLGYVQWALKTIADTEPAFAPAFGAGTEPYERPFKDDWYGNSWRRGRTMSSAMSLSARITDNGIEVTPRLDLDDLWHLYYLLEDVIEPSEQIANAMNKARYDEQRGMLMMKAGMDKAYSNRNLKSENRMGSLANENPADLVPAMMQDTLSLYALGQIDERMFLQRVMDLADHTLAGRLVDPAGALPSYALLTDQRAEQGGALMTYEAALHDRVRDVLRIMTGASDKDAPLSPALMRKIAEIARPLRQKLNRQAEESSKASFRKMSQTPSGGFSLFSDDVPDLGAFAGIFAAEEDDISDDPFDLRETWGKTAGNDETRSMARQANIALRSSAVGDATNRPWRDTDYVSRSGGSLWVRKELPSALRPFVSTAPRPDMGRMMRALTNGPGR